MKNKISTSLILGFMIMFAFLSCENSNMLDHYEVPDWLKGSAWEVLEDRGNYSIFLEGVESAGYKPLMGGKSILTVMAPDDDAFKAYLSKKGYSSIKDMEESDLKKLIGFHLLYYSYNKERMINFRPEGDLATDKDKEKNAGLYYKFRSRSANPLTTVYDKASKTNINIYHLERFLPVFSYKFFQTKEIDAKTNYEYFYPNSKWTGEAGFNASNASIDEYQIIADNGYIYAVDQVLEPLETIYTTLKNNVDYSKFLDLYDGYTSYEYDETLSDDYGKAIGVDSLYLHKHGTLPPIAMEWPVSSFQNVRDLASVSYSIFALSNNALDNFFDRYWRVGGYLTLGQVDPLVIKHLLNQYVYGGSIVFPEEITNKKIKNSYGVYFDFDPATVKDKSICINGSLYGLDNITTPPLFNSVAGPAFRDRNKAPFLYALDGSSLLNSYVSPDIPLTVIMPLQAQLNNGGIYLNTYTTGNVLQIESEDGWANLSTSEKQHLVNMHTINGSGDLLASGTKVYPTQEVFNFFFVKDGKITTNALYNKIIEPGYTGTPFTTLTEVTNNGANWSNGRVYTYEESEELFEVDKSDGLNYALAINNDQRYPFNYFVQLLRKANLISGTTINGLQEGRFVAFIPSNEAIAEALNNDLIPGLTGARMSNGTLTGGTVDLNALRKYMNSHFIRSIDNVITTYPYIGSNFRSTTYLAASGDKVVYSDTGTDLKIQLDGRPAVSVTSKYDYFPFAYSDGCFHLLDSIL